MRRIFLIWLVLSGLVVNGRTSDRLFPMTATTLQFAGSTGFLTAGMFKGTKNERIQLGLLYGHTPKLYGGPLNSLSLKFLYVPFHIGLGKWLYIEPVQTGAFLSQNFGNSLYYSWPEKYPKNYYWWTPSLRGHVFLSTSLGVRTDKLKWIEKISCYFEANTNDLYVASYAIKKNHNSLSFYDIIFFGTGLKFYLRSR
jgi:hypothetical protein